jgi:hypothetical protein
MGCRLCECFFCVISTPNRDPILGSRDSLLELFCVINEAYSATKVAGNRQLIYAE